jgi:hypothetical protein
MWPELKAALAVAVGLLTLAASDALIWGHIFEAQHMNHIASLDRVYHVGYLAVLAGLIGVGMVALWSWWSLWYAAALGTLAQSGLEDVLYYWLDRRPLPTALPWLDAQHPLIPFHPVTSDGLVLSVCLWLGFWAVTLMVLAWWRSVRVRQVPAQDRPDSRYAA